MKVLIDTDAQGITHRVIHCPACKCGHNFHSGRWQMTGSSDSPTFTPSMLVRYPSGGLCHSIVTDGEITFLNDCTHNLAGKTVMLEEYD